MIDFLIWHHMKNDLFIVKSKYLSICFLPLIKRRQNYTTSCLRCNYHSKSLKHIMLFCPLPKPHGALSLWLELSEIPLLCKMLDFGAKNTYLKFFNRSQSSLLTIVGRDGKVKIPPFSKERKEIWFRLEMMLLKNFKFSHHKSSF